jgi:hypothetical protein
MIHFNEDLKLSYKQLDTVFSTAFNVLESLPPVAINQLVGGYGGDVDALLSEIFIQTNNVLSLNTTLETERLNYIDQLEESMDETLKVQSYNYFKTTMLPNFRQGWRNLEWGNMVQLYPNSAYLAARSHGKCFARGTRVLMADFSVKNIEDIYPGMEVMGLDFTPRKVLTRHIGRAQMFRVEQENGMPYAVNRAHTMCLFDTKRKKYVEIEMGQFLKYPVKKQRRFQGYRVFSYDKPVFERGNITVEPIGEESYYGFMCDGDHLFQLEDGTVVHNSYEFCMAFPLWRLYSYRRPTFMRPDIPDNKNRQETCIITNTEKLGKQHIDSTPSARFFKEGYEQFQELVDKFLLLSYIQAGAERSFETIDIRSMVSSVLARYQTDIAAKNLSVTNSVESMTIYQNRKLFEFVVTSLIDNAIKFNKDGGTIVISTKPSLKTLSIQVNDSGIGIDSTKLGQLFQPFTRATSVAEFNYEGLGFSLFLDRLIMKYTDGIIKITSTPNRGTASTVTVPRSNTPTSWQASSSSQSPARHYKGGLRTAKQG